MTLAHCAWHLGLTSRTLGCGLTRALQQLGSDFSKVCRLVCVPTFKSRWTVLRVLVLGNMRNWSLELCLGAACPLRPYTENCVHMSSAFPQGF